MSLKPVISASVIFLAPLISIGCSPCPEAELPSVYVGFQSNSEEDVKLAKDFLIQLYKESDVNNLFHIDHLEGNETIRLYSDESDRNAINEIVQNINVVSSNDEAIVRFFQNVKDLATQSSREQRELHAYLLSPGTSEASSLNKIREIVEGLNTNEELDVSKIYIYLIGLTDNRDEMSIVLNSIRERAESSSPSRHEWRQLTEDYNSYYCSISE